MKRDAIWFITVFICAASACAAPPKPDYASKPVSALDAGKAAATLSGRKAVNNIVKDQVPKIAEAATTTAVFDGTGNATRALDYGKVAGKMAKGALGAKNLYDTGILYYGLGGAAADIQTLGLQDGSIAASERLSEISAARPWVTLGKYLGEKVAAAVWNIQKSRRTIHPEKNAKAGEVSQSFAGTPKEETPTPTLIKDVQDKDDVVDANSRNLAGEVGVRGWCKCPNRSANIVTGPLFRMGEDFNVADYSYFFCGDCYKCRKDFNDVADIIKDGTICIWDVKVARANGLDGKTIPDVKAQQQLSEAQDRIMQIPDGKVVIPGLCRCESPRIWLFGELPKRIEMCKDCGRPRSPIPLSAKNPRQPRKLRRCRKTSTSIFVCTCAGDTGVKPNIHASPYDDGDVELSLVCTKCSQVKYSAFVPVREFKKKFANGKPDPQAMLVYMIGTVDIKAAMLAADKEASSQN